MLQSIRKGAGDEMIRHANGGVTLTAKEWLRAKRQLALLAALEAAGVFDWEGYGEAVGSLEEDEEE